MRLVERLINFMSAGAMLLNNFLGATVNPEDYRNHLVAGQFFDEQGHQTNSPYKNPSFWARFANPEMSSRLIAENERWRMAAPTAQRAADIQYNESLRRAGINAPNIPGNTMTPAQMVAAGINTMAPEELEKIKKSQERQKLGLPALEAIRDRNQAYFLGDFYKNQGNEEAIYGLGGGPQQAASNRLIGGINTGNQLQLNAALFPITSQTDLLKADQDLWRTQNINPAQLARERTLAEFGSAAAPFEGQGAYNTAKLNSLIAGQDLYMSPTILGTRATEQGKLNALSGLVGEPNAMMPWAMQYKNGMVQTGANPLFNPNAMQMGAEAQSQVPGLQGVFTAPGLGANLSTYGQQPIPLGDGYQIDPTTNKVVFVDDKGNHNPNPVVTEKQKEKAAKELEKQQKKLIGELPHGTMQILKDTNQRTGQQIYNTLSPLVGAINPMNTVRYVSRQISGE